MKAAKAAEQAWHKITRRWNEGAEDREKYVKSVSRTKEIQHCKADNHLRSCHSVMLSPPPPPPSQLPSPIAIAASSISIYICRTLTAKWKRMNDWLTEWLSERTRKRAKKYNCLKRTTRTTTHLSHSQFAIVRIFIKKFMSVTYQQYRKK